MEDSDSSDDCFKITCRSTTSPKKSMFLEELFYSTEHTMPQVLDIDPNGDVVLTLQEERVAIEESTTAREQSQDKSKSCPVSSSDPR